ncbi:hypothetical protein DdX_20083 [Ditylenchus destructor]|uniref:Uncharacterized protein n=1 Tax=Ditylenchus destructor TaxID=166010 RepID=A0AAD4QS03_9BILA|nr:hypothetical protein DdX_20083 [Ditylenchus destructor]
MFFCSESDSRHSPSQQHKFRLSTPQSAVIVCVLILSSIPASDALACYVSDGNLALIEDNPDWTFCVMTPKLGNQKASRFGVGPENDDLGLNSDDFTANMPFYRHISQCSLEKYNFHRFMRTSAETMLRCICNSDLCNAETDLYKYFATLSEDALLRDDKK